MWGHGWFQLTYDLGGCKWVPGVWEELSGPKVHLEMPGGGGLATRGTLAGN
jgi:hypothetical protein